MATIIFSSVLTSGYREDLEALLFFNSNQASIQARITHMVQRYGQPKVVSDGGLLRVAVGAVPAVQALYALDRAQPGHELIGVIVFVRDQRERLAILHIAVREDYSAVGPEAGAMLAMRLINEVRNVASRLRGVRAVTLMYQPARIRTFPVRYRAEVGTDLAATSAEGGHVH